MGESTKSNHNILSSSVFQLLLAILASPGLLGKQTSQIRRMPSTEGCIKLGIVHSHFLSLSHCFLKPKKENK